jgi:hypothetical protein
VKENAKLTLKHITIQGPAQDCSSIILISTSGDLVFESGASVKDGKKSNGGETGGVHVKGGKFIMNKGTISGKKSGDWGGGVRVDNMLNDKEEVIAFGTFTMNGGSIRGNTGSNVASGGGVAIWNNATFTMNGGVISGNSAGRGGGVVLDGSNGTFTMYGGSIRDNSSTSNGGGVLLNGNSGTFTMYGGSIRDNTGGDGGGVVIQSGSQFTMDGGVISGNKAVRGGGVDSGGGGVGVFGGNNSTFTMNGGVISGNKAGNGGGVFVDPGEQFTKNGGVIYGDTDTSHSDGDIENTATSGKGHAVYMGGSQPKERNSTAGKDDNLDSPGDWE